MKWEFGLDNSSNHIDLSFVVYIKEFMEKLFLFKLRLVYSHSIQLELLRVYNERY